MNIAALEFQSHHDFKGNIEQVTVRNWDGPKDGILEISTYFWDDLVRNFSVKTNPQIGDVITIGPYRLRVFEQKRLVYRLVRTDSLLGNLKVYIYKSSCWLDLVYRRLIITASVWKLAEYRPEYIPSYENLHIVQRFKK